MRLLLVLAFVIPMLAETPKPVCDQKSRGRFWPEEANRDRKLMFELSRQGQLEMCSAHGKLAKKFQWETVGVHVSQLPRTEEPPKEQAERQ